MIVQNLKDLDLDPSSVPDHKNDFGQIISFLTVFISLPI